MEFNKFELELLDYLLDYNNSNFNKLKQQLKNITFVTILSCIFSTTLTLANSEPVTISTVKVGNFPAGIVVNPNTNKAYVYNVNDKAISIINGSGTITTTLNNITKSSIAINTKTNKIYTNGFLVINGDDNTIKHFAPKDSDIYGGIAVNPETNSIYMTNVENGYISVFSGSNNNFINDVGLYPSFIAINSKTNRLYVASRGSDSVSVMNGDTNKIITTIRVGGSPHGIAVNSNTNTIYVANSDSNTVSVIDGATNIVNTTIGVGEHPNGIDVSSNTNNIYVANFDSNNVSVIDGENNEVINTITVGIKPLGITINPKTNTLYVGNAGSYTVSIISNPNSKLYKNSQVDTDPWRQYQKSINDKMDNVFAKLDEKFGIFPIKIGITLFTPYEDYMKSQINKIDILLKSNTLSEKYRVFLNIVKSRLEKKIKGLYRVNYQD